MHSKHRPALRERLTGALAGALLAAAAGAPAEGQVLNFRHYTATDGLPQAQILALHQDASLFVWVGTYGGLSRYNGDEFHTYATAHGLASNAITAIAEDSAGRIHVGSIGGGVCTLVTEKITCLGADHGLPHNDVYDILVDADGTTLWVATLRGVARMAGGVIRGYGRDEGVPGSHVQRLLRDRHGSIWVAADEGLARWSGSQFVPMHRDELGGTAVSMLLDTRWGLMVGSGDRLFLAREGLLRPVPLPPARGGNGRITDGAVDAKGDVWIATHAGALHYDGQRFQRYTVSNGLLFDQVTRVRVDREGNVWFGTERGLSRLTPGPFRHYGAREGLPNPFVRAISADTRGRLWLGTRDGVAVRDGDSLRIVDLGSLPDRRVFSLAALPDGGMLIGTRGGGLVHHDGVRVRRVYRVADGLPGDIVAAMTPDGNGGIWLGTNRGLARWQAGTVTPVSGHAALDDRFILSVARDARGRLWAGFRQGGLVVYDGTTTVSIGQKQGLTNQTIWAIAQGPDGAMWAGTNGDGVYLVQSDNPADIRQMTTADGLIDNSIWQVQPDGRGAMWLYTNRGIDRVSAVAVDHYGRGRGLLELEGSANASWLDAGGEMWFGTSIGLVRYSPYLDLPSAIRPPVFIGQATSGPDTLPAHGARVRAGQGVLKIRFASPTYRDESGVRFRYRLLGASTEWSDPTPERSIGYAGLAPGKYEFQVFALDGDGAQSEHPAALSFVVEPRFWQAWWFRVLAGMLLLAAAAVITTRRTRALREERGRLEREVAARTGELITKNSDLEREVVERQRAEDALRESQHRVSEIIEYSTNMFYSHTADGMITYVSPQSRRLLGCEPEEALRRYQEFLTDHPANGRCVEATRRALETGEKQPPYELELCGADGVTRWVEVNEAPVIRNGRTVGLVGSLTDVTEAKRAAAEQARLELQLRQAQKMEAVGRLAGGIAHDFNNLLTAVVGNTELVAAGIDPGHPLQTELAEVHRAADRAASLVAQLLAFSRQQLVRRRVLDLNVVVTESARMLARMIGSDIELGLELGTGPLEIEADQAQLDQVLITLALTARDAMPRGGRLTIETRAIEARGGPDEEPEPPGCILLRVSDTGHGMDAETIRHVFEPFFTTKDVGKGTGLGLATVYGIVTQNGGTVRIASETDLGTRFDIFLPRANPDRTAAATPAPNAPACTTPDTPARNAGTVLVAEDEPAVRRLVCRALADHGFQVLEAPDGTRALEVSAAYDGRIDLLLTDMVMPGLNGREVAGQISLVRPEIRVLYMSGHTRDALGSRFVLDSEIHLVQKPFLPTELIQHVLAALGAHSLTATE
jgi:PAS domain S-box-containing protein